MGRRILHFAKLGTLSTVFPSTTSHGPNGQEVRPGDMGGQPIGLMDYVADCEDEGNPTILAIKIGTSFKNAQAGSNITLSMRWIPPYPPARRMSLLSRLSVHIPCLSKHRPYNHAQETTPDTVPYSAANLPRFSLFGYLESIPTDPNKIVQLAACYTRKHPDAKYWLPGNPIHESEWMRLIVTHVYWVGGFGDRAYIGWIPVEEWQKVTRKEWESIELSGEKKGWSEWSADSSQEL